MVDRPCSATDYSPRPGNCPARALAPSETGARLLGRAEFWVGGGEKRQPGHPYVQSEDSARLAAGDVEQVGCGPPKQTLLVVTLPPS